MTGPPRDTAGVIAPPPLIFLVPLIGGILLNRWYSIPLVPQPYGRIIGSVVVVIAIALFVWAHSAFSRAHTEVNPFKPSTAIVDTGPYARTRNPLYWSMVFISAGVSLIVDTAWPILLLPLALFVLQTGVITREERYLEGKFGKDYTDYKSRVKRWL